MALSPNWSRAPDGTKADALTNTQYLEYKESGKESFADNSSHATRVFLVNWDIRADFLDDLLGYSYLDGQLTIHRILPDEHPEISNFYVANASVEGMGILSNSDNDHIAWTTAKISCEYKPFPYDFKDDNETTTEQDRYTERKYGFAIDYMTVNGAMQFVSRTTKQGKVLTNPPGKATGTQNLQYVWHDVPGKTNNPFVPPNLTNINTCLGTVNSVAFDVKGGNYPAGTILFVGVDPQMQTPKLTDDVFYWTITFSFLYRNNGAGIQTDPAAGHQYIFDQANNRYDLITADGTFTGPRIYQTSDLNTLWQIS